MAFEIKKPVEKPAFSSYDKTVSIISLGTIGGGIFTGGVFLSTHTVLALGMVFALYISVARFKPMRWAVVKFQRWIDLVVLVAGVVIADDMEGVITAVFVGIFIAAYLSIHRFVILRQLWKSKPKGATA